MTEMIEANLETAQPVIELMEARNPLGRIGRVDDSGGHRDLSRQRPVALPHRRRSITIDGGHRASIY